MADMTSGTKATQVNNGVPAMTSCTKATQFNGTQVNDGVSALIDRYKILEKLGGGSFGCVFRAFDLVAGLDVAVKGLPPLIRTNPEELEKVRINFALVAKLHHPGIASAMHLHQAESVFYANEEIHHALRVEAQDYLMVMEYVPGVTISAWRRQFPGKRVPLKAALEVCRQIAEALDFAHTQRVIHRDIKPANVMVVMNLDGKLDDPSALIVKVLDFGLAAEIRASMSRVSREQWDNSGTPLYMAPEQWSGKKQWAAADQYALAALFYELASGAVPFASVFETNNPVIMMNTVLTQKVEPVGLLTEAQNCALRRALDKDPKKRFDTCADFVASLAGGGKKRQSGAVWVALIAVLFMLAAMMLRGVLVPSSPKKSQDSFGSVGGANPPKSAIKKDAVNSTPQSLSETKLRFDVGKSKDESNSTGDKVTAEIMLEQPMTQSAMSSNATPLWVTNSVTNDDLKLELTTFDGRNEYADGEKIGYRIRTSGSSHVAVYCIQSDGKIVLLFPNAWSQATWIQGGKWLDVPGPVASGFEIIASPPHGIDVVYVVACSEQSSFHKTMKVLAASSVNDKRFATISESMLSLPKPGAVVNSIKVRIQGNDSVVNR